MSIGWDVDQDESHFSGFAIQYKYLDTAAAYIHYFNQAKAM